jgi:hypothetical protein
VTDSGIRPQLAPGLVVVVRDEASSVRATENAADAPPFHARALGLKPDRYYVSPCMQRWDAVVTDESRGLPHSSTRSIRAARLHPVSDDRFDLRSQMDRAPQWWRGL